MNETKFTIKEPSYIVNPDSHITLTFDNGDTSTTFHGEYKFNKLLNAVKLKDWQKAYDIVYADIEAVTETIDSISNEDYGCRIEHGVVYVNNEPMHNVITQRILMMKAQGFDIAPMSAFLMNLLSNPSFRAVNELYGFLEATQLPITPDGHFIAYKKVRSDYKDCHSGKIDNSIGQVVTMPRNKVNDNKDETCSDGLHFCGRSYLTHFQGQRTLVLKINPADVVSIPTDYNFAKGRTCRYEVIQELEIDNSNNMLPVEDMEKSSVVRVNVHAEDKILARFYNGDTVGVFDTVEDAALYTSIPIADINEAMENPTHNITTDGISWSIKKATMYDFSDVEDEDEDEDECSHCVVRPDWWGECRCCLKCGGLDTSCIC